MQAEIDTAQPPHLVVVDDQSDVGMIIRKLGQRDGIAIAWFPTAEDAWAHLQRHGADLLLFDVELPGISGVELCRRIRALPHHQGTPVAMFTPDHDAKKRAELRDAGADFFLTKDLLAEPTVWQQKIRRLARTNPPRGAALKTGRIFRKPSVEFVYALAWHGASAQKLFQHPWNTIPMVWSNREKTRWESCSTGVETTSKPQAAEGSGMTYEEAIQFWLGRVNFEQKSPQVGDFKLGRMRHLLDLLGNPEHTLRIVHIAGSKGKGSTSALLGSILQAAGFSVGLFTSPHLVHVEERIQVDRQAITHDELAALMREIRAAASPELDARADVLRDRHRARLSALRPPPRRFRDRRGRPRRALRFDQRLYADGLDHHQHQFRSHANARQHAGPDRV